MDGTHQGGSNGDNDMISVYKAKMVGEIQQESTLPSTHYQARPNMENTQIWMNEKVSVSGEDCAEQYI